MRKAVKDFPRHLNFLLFSPGSSEVHSAAACGRVLSSFRSLYHRFDAYLPSSQLLYMGAIVWG